MTVSFRHIFTSFLFFYFLYLFIYLFTTRGKTRTVKVFHFFRVLNQCKHCSILSPCLEFLPLYLWTIYALTWSLLPHWTSSPRGLSSSFRPTSWTIGTTRGLLYHRTPPGLPRELHTIWIITFRDLTEHYTVMLEKVQPIKRELSYK